MSSLIKDQTEFNTFVSIFPEMQKDEVAFISLAARNKYLNEEEREFYQLGRTEMFGRLVVRSKDDFNMKMNELSSKRIARKTRNGKDIPDECVVCYANINPSSMIKAYDMFMIEMNKEVFSAFNSEQNQKQANYESIRRMDRVLMNCIQKSRSRKVYIDIDMDTKDPDLFEVFVNNLTIEYDPPTFHIIEPHGGYHFLIKNDTIPKELNLGKLVQDADKVAKKTGKEVVFNKNQMIPIPGTLQSGFPVKFKHMGC